MKIFFFRQGERKKIKKIPQKNLTRIRNCFSGSLVPTRVSSLRTIERDPWVESVAQFFINFTVFFLNVFFLFIFLIFIYLFFLRFFSIFQTYENGANTNEHNSSSSISPSSSLLGRTRRDLSPASSTNAGQCLCPPGE